VNPVFSCLLWNAVSAFASLVDLRAEIIDMRIIHGWGFENRGFAFRDGGFGSWFGSGSRVV